MKKSMYCLMLEEQVVESIDRLAQAQNTNRSKLVNEILADYLSLTTPDRHINNIFNALESIFDESGHKAAYALHDNTLSVKSSLVYRYRPTLRYEVELYRSLDRKFGQLKVNFRTQSPELLVALTEFFKLWARLEETYIARFFPEDSLIYTLDETRFTRSLSLPKDANYETDDYAKAIGAYIQTFDYMIKKYLSGNYLSTTDLENDYLNYLNSGNQLI